MRLPSVFVALHALAFLRAAQAVLQASNKQSLGAVGATQTNLDSYAMICEVAHSCDLPVADTSTRAERGAERWGHDVQTWQRSMFRTGGQQTVR